LCRLPRSLHRSVLNSAEFCDKRFQWSRSGPVNFTSRKSFRNLANKFNNSDSAPKFNDSFQKYHKIRLMHVFQHARYLHGCFWKTFLAPNVHSSISRDLPEHVGILQRSALEIDKPIWVRTNMPVQHFTGSEKIVATECCSQSWKCLCNKCKFPHDLF
jgi:hypothetical protein